MKLTLNEKNRGIKIAWFFLVITIGAFLNDLRNAQELTSNGSSGFEVGYMAGGKLGLATLLGMGMFLYKRTKARKFKKPVWGPKIIDYVLVFILSINFIFPLLSGRWVNGTGDDVLAFFYTSSSLLAYAYALLAKPKVLAGTST